MSILFPIIYSAALTYLVWKAFKVMSNGWGISDNKNKRFSTSSFKQKKYTIHPELLDKSGNITEEELLTVRFSNENDSSLEEKGSSADYENSVKEVLKLKGNVRIVSPGDLPNDGKVIDDQRTFD